jgi:hypothetical protein
LAIPAKFSKGDDHLGGEKVTDLIGLAFFEGEC